ncbi:YceD family protein [Ruegeria sp. HU-ET01832]|uniref:YceD family protein n=1 Tax=Ruegeria sp. HU-ET01832 TaxID=3135906 RepID=UPI00310B4613
MSNQTSLRVADLPQNTSTPFDLRPDAKELAVIREDLGLLGLRKLSFVGDVRAEGKRDWMLAGKLGATVIQPCVVTLEPVTTRIDVPVTRVYLADWTDPDEEEFEIPEGDESEPLGHEIDPGLVMTEALSLALPQYPRKDGAELEQADYTEPGKQAMTDEDAKPFAGLASLRDALKKDE